MRKRNLILSGVVGFLIMTGMFYANAAVFYVHPTGNNTSGIGTLETPWQTISHAVRQAAQGDTIKVMDDNNANSIDYTENISVNKSLVIEAFDPTGTRPQIKASDAGTHVVTILANDVTIRGLDLYGATSSFKSGIYMNYRRNVVLENNRCGWNSTHKNEVGINLEGCTECMLYNNTCNYANYHGIRVKNSSGNTITGNTCRGNTLHGIFLYTTSNRNSVINNTCAYNNDGGIRLQESSQENTLKQNTIINNTYGIELVDNSNSNRFYLNVVKSNTSKNIYTLSTTNLWYSEAKIQYHYHDKRYENFLGNFWGDYNGQDANNDGIGDASFDTNEGSTHRDRYPLITESLQTAEQGELMVTDNLDFQFFKEGEPVRKKVPVINGMVNDVRITNISFDNDAFSVENELPLSISSSAATNLNLQINPIGTGLYQAQCEIAFEAGEDTRTVKTNVSSALFLEDGSELAYTADRSLTVYNQCLNDDPNSPATRNNLSVLFYLLGEPEIAGDTLMTTLSRGLNAMHGYTGMKMNMGVIQSEQANPTQANDYYDLALKDVSSSESQSAIAPQVYYNQAWEDYIGDKLTESATKVEKTLQHGKTNNFLKAKAYVLRGAIRYRQQKVTAAQSDFETAISLDPDGPIGELAKANLGFITGIDPKSSEHNLPQIFVLMPNYPNPFNPETTVSFGLPAEGEVELSIFNVLGQKIRTLYQGQQTAGWKTITWYGDDLNGNPVSSGVYLLQMKAGDFITTRKMSLLK